MTPLQWVLLCVLFTLYLLFGGSIFMYFEQHREIEKKEEISVLRKDIKEILFLLDRDFYHNDTNKELIHALTAAKIGVLNRISAACDVGDLLPDAISDTESVNLGHGSEGQILLENSTTTADPEEDKLKWNFYNSIFFAFTVITTIGYGHLSPSTSYSKMFVMAYALIGIPINSILLSGLGDYFSSRLVKVHKKSKEKPDRKCTFVLQILFYLLPGILIFIIVPAGIFVVIEQWTFLDSVYYAFVSLTTIGFGDYVAGMGNGHTVWMWIYKAFIIIWITFGLGYLIMILGFISKGMTHKRVRVVIEKRLNTIRVTKEKLSRDIDYMRRVVNELYLMKINPVYEAEEKIHDNNNSNVKRRQSDPCVNIFEKRYSSLPGLPIYPYHPPMFGGIGIDEELSNQNFQNHLQLSNDTTKKLQRRSSESDLSRIDRDRTFESALRNQVTVDELLVSVVNALSGNVMHEVMEAVEELNECEDEILMENDPNYTPTHPPQHNHPLTPAIHRTPHHIQRYTTTDDSESDDLPPWDLGALSESDEEVLIGEEDEENLQQVVVQDDGSKDRQISGGNLMDKVSGAIRKISTGSKTASEGPSRKVSRNESFRRNERKTSSGGTSTYKPITRAFLNPQAYANANHPGKDHKRKISEESRISSTGSRRSGTTDFYYPNGPGSNSNSSSRKVSPSNFPTSTDFLSKSRISLESTSLAEFLHALDTVHSKLHSNKTSVHSLGDASQFSDDFINPQIGGSGQMPQRFRKSWRGRHSFGSFTGNFSEKRESHPRKRKNGIIHPNFAFVNSGFVEDSLRLDNEQDDDFDKDEKKHPHRDD